MNQLSLVCEKAAKSGGKVLLELAGRVTATEKGRHDLVTEADIQSQAAAFAIIRQAFPDHRLVGEEDEHQMAADFCPGEGTIWLIDPLDGTTNYIHGFPHFCVSVAAVRVAKDKTELVCGTIFDPCRDECFSATRGEGATLNGRSIHTSSTRRMQQSLLAASLPPVVTHESLEVETMLRAMGAARSVRRTGSAALNLAYVAAGRLDGYWATSLSAWDAAAGAIMIEEAGGMITGFNGGKFDVFRPQLVAAGNRELHLELAALTGRSKQG